MWLSLECLLQEKLPSDSILIARLIRHAAWSLTRFQVQNEGRTAVVRVFGKAYTSQVLPFGTSNLDRRWGHGIWAPMTDEHIILTENGVQKARSLHRVPPEERFVISELMKVRSFPWNGRAENLKATTVTQQDQGPSGHRRVYLTTKVVARHGATPGCSGCLGLGPHTEACRVRLEKAWLTRERVHRFLSLPPSPRNQHRWHSRSQHLHRLVLLRQCQHKTFRWIHRWSWDHKNAESAKERGQARRQQVNLWKTRGKGEASGTTNDRADGGRFGYRPARTR